MLSLGIYGSTTSTAQHSDVTPAQSSKPSTCGSEYISKEACTYMHAAPGLLFWGIKLLSFASHLFASKMLHHLLHLPFCSILLFGERSWRNRPLREAPYVLTWLHIRTCTNYPGTAPTLHIRGMMKHLYCYTPINRMSFSMTTLRFHTIKTKICRYHSKNITIKVGGKRESGAGNTDLSLVMVVVVAAVVNDAGCMYIRRQQQ